MNINSNIVKTSFIVITAMLLVSGCQSLSSMFSKMNEPRYGLGNAEYYTYLLANELFDGVLPSAQSRYAVVGFVPADTLKQNSDLQHSLVSLSEQLEEGMITEAIKRGFTTQEFKLSNDILISERSDRVLTRDIEQLSQSERIDFFITGTYVYQEAGAMVNARIISAQTKDIVAAATRFFPADIFWEQEQVTTRNGRLYRTENQE